VWFCVLIHVCGFASEYMVVVVRLNTCVWLCVIIHVRHVMSCCTGQCYECVSCSAENQSGHDTHISTDAQPHLIIFWPARMENPSPACLLDASAERLSFSQISMM